MGNTSTNGYGGGIHNLNAGSGPITMTNCVFTGNSAAYGGGIENDNFTFSTGTISVTNCTLTGNTATSGSGNGGGIGDNDYILPITLTNDIVYGDTGGEVAGMSETANFCDIGDPSYAGTFGNIDANPLFVNAPADLHLQSGSPCLGAGTPNGAPTTTIDGQCGPLPTPASARMKSLYSSRRR